MPVRLRSGPSTGLPGPCDVGRNLGEPLEPPRDTGRGELGPTCPEVLQSGNEIPFRGGTREIQLPHLLLRRAQVIDRRLLDWIYLDYPDVSTAEILSRSRLVLVGQEQDVRIRRTHARGEKSHALVSNDER